MPDPTLCHIVPSVPPEFNGLGDYCFQLWKHWPEPRPGWQILSRRIPVGARERWPEAKIQVFELSKDGLLAELKDTGADTVVLHYVGYSYAKRGAPMWLPAALAKWKEVPGRRLVVMFHELYATSPPWRSPFWLCLSQIHVVRKLAKVSDRWITSCPRYMKFFRSFASPDYRKGTMIPIGATIDPVREPDWDRQWPLNMGAKLRVVNFGMPLTRLRTLRFHRSFLKLLCDRGLLDSLLLTGRSETSGEILDETTEILAEIGCSNLVGRSFDLETEELSALLLTQHVGLIHNPWSALTKSTVYAAYCAHGLLTLIPPEPGTQPGPYVINDDSHPETCLQELEGCSFQPDRAESERYLFSTVSAQFAQVCSFESEK
jgi:hypothetical protein